MQCIFTGSCPAPWLAGVTVQPPPRHVLHAPQQTRHGIAVIGGILLRPTLLVFGFVFSFLLLSTAGQLLGLIFGVVFASVSSNSGIGFVAFVTLLGVLVAKTTLMVYFIALLITHLAEHAPTL
jgi:conjugal transfer/type IV secretion protein DotA/TraY